MVFQLGERLKTYSPLYYVTIIKLLIIDKGRFFKALSQTCVGIFDSCGYWSVNSFSFNGNT